MFVWCVLDFVDHRVMRHIPHPRGCFRECLTGGMNLRSRYVVGLGLPLFVRRVVQRWPVDWTGALLRLSGDVEQVRVV